MSRRTSPLDADAVDELPERCRRCLYWELGLDRPGEEDPPDVQRDARVRKQAWVTSRSLEDGPPGVLVRQHGVVVGYALFAPSRALPARTMLRPGISGDALHLATAWLRPDARAGGLGRLLVLAAVREAIDRDLAAVEVVGDRRAREWDCVLPATWLLHEGFEVAREHPRYPVLRLETRRTARWATSLEHAAADLLGRVARPARVPVTEPVHAERGTITGPG